MTVFALKKPAVVAFQACLWCADPEACRRRRLCGVEARTPELFGGSPVIDLADLFEPAR